MTTAVVCTALTGENGLEIQEWPEPEIGPAVWRCESMRRR